MSKHTTLDQLKMLAQRSKTEIDKVDAKVTTLSGRVDDLVEQTQIPARRVLSAMTLLQIQGYVAEENGKRFRAAVKLKME